MEQWRPPPPLSKGLDDRPSPLCKKKSVAEPNLSDASLLKLSEDFWTNSYISCASTSKETLFHPEQSVQLQFKQLLLQLHCSSNPVEVSKFFRVTLH